MKILKSKHITVFVLVLAAAYFYYYCKLRPISDPDTYYHAAAAILTAQNGHFNPGDSMPFSIYKSYPNDQHFGYHWLQSWFAKDLNSLKTFQAFLCFACFAVFLKLAKDINPKLFLWACILLISSFGFVNRITIIKASALSVSFYLLLIYGFLHSYLGLIFITSLAFYVCHSGFLIIVFVCIAHFISDFRNKTTLKNLSACICGIAVGILIHPDQINYLKFLYFQGFELAFLKNYSNQIPIGQEWSQPNLKTIIISNLPILIAITPALTNNFKKSKIISIKNNFLFINLIIISLLYYRSERFIEYFIPAALLFSLTRINNIAVIASVIFTIAWQPISVKTQLEKKSKSLPKKLVIWLEEKHNKDKMICNLDWSNYPELLYLFPNNKYLYGSDPRYLAFENQTLYQKTADLIYSPSVANVENVRQLANCNLLITNEELSGEFLQEAKNFGEYKVLVFND